MPINYYNEVVKVTKKYLGPAAERFINRQIEFHLSKDPKTIDKEDVSKLKDSLRVALSLLVNDKELVDNAIKDFEAITKNEEKHE